MDVELLIAKRLWIPSSQRNNTMTIQFSPVQTQQTQSAPAGPLTFLQVRRGSKGDRPEVCRLEMACFGRARLLFGLWWLIGKPKTELWVAEDTTTPDKNLVGYVILYPNELEHTMLPYVGGVGVTTEQRKAGIGSQMMLAVLAEHPQLWLHVRASNVAAIRLYQKLGLAEFKRIEKFYSNGEGALILATMDLSNLR